MPRHSRLAPREGSAVILIAPDGRILLQQRDDDVPPAGAGRWAIPGGGREGDESPRETALREFEEETGARLQRLRFFRTLTPASIPDLRSRTLHVFFADDEVPEAEIVVHEGLAFRYWSPTEIERLPMNPSTRTVVDCFLADDKYLGTVAFKAPYRAGVSVLALDRWGRVLLQLRDDDLPPERFPGHWSMLGGLVQPGESPDAAALREFEEETGHLLDEIRVYRVFRRDPDVPTALVDLQHVYYVDADLEESRLSVNEGQAFRYFAPGELRGLRVPPHTLSILDAFFASPAYRALFH